jgi:hypothetical protein
VLVEDITIYNVYFSQIIETRDLVLTYTKL